MVAWAIELSEFKIIYEQQKAIKTQALANFIVEMTKLEGESIVQREWMLYVNSLSNEKGSRAGIILEGPNDITLKYSLKFDF